jgi:hypothetical protein
MNIRTFKPSGTVLIAAVALVIGLEAPAAAHQVAQQISGSTIKVHSIAGNRLKANTLTGKQIKESTLGTVPKAKLATTLPKMVWHNVTLKNSWTTGLGYGSPQWAVDAEGIVHLRGYITGGTVGDAAFTLPAAERPAHNTGTVVLNEASSASYLFIVPAGGVEVFNLIADTNAGAGIFLNGVTFSTG